MNRHYVVMRTDGYYKVENKKDALRYLQECSQATHVIYTRSQEGNYYHNRIKIVA